MEEHHLRRQARQGVGDQEVGNERTQSDRRNQQEGILTRATSPNARVGLDPHEAQNDGRGIPHEQLQPFLRGQIRQTR